MTNFDIFSVSTAPIELISAAILSGKASLYHSKTNGSGSIVSDLPIKLPFVPYFCLLVHRPNPSAVERWSEGQGVMVFPVGRRILKRLRWLTTHTA
ncbi:MAG: hypothetical protein GY820_05625 [Gammaproteobacteria bacterium]|nr:hypothetical protein [Gammaproteobacteria bacterium]